MYTECKLADQCEKSVRIGAVGCAISGEEMVCVQPAVPGSTEGSNLETSFSFIPYRGNMIQFDECFSKGLRPPTRYGLPMKFFKS